MKKQTHIKRVVLFLLVLMLAVCGLSGCGKYYSHYNAVGFAHSNKSDSAWMSFVEFDGAEVFKMKCKSGETARIQYSGKLETGSLTVYYDCGEAKTELFSIQAGEEVNACSDPLTEGTVYIIVETDGKCRSGDFGFELIYD